MASSLRSVPSSLSQPLMSIVSETPVQEVLTPRSFQNRYNAIADEVSTVEERLPHLEAIRVNHIRGIPQELTEIRQEVRALIQKSNASFNQFTRNLNPYQRDQITRLNERFATNISRLTYIAGTIDRTPEELRATIQQGRKATCVGITLGIAFVAGTCYLMSLMHPVNRHF